MRSTVLALAFLVTWSSGFVGAELAAGVSSVSAMLAWRYLVTAGLLLLALFPLRPRLTAREIRQQTVLGLLAHVCFLGGVFGAAAAGVDASTTALVCALQPALVATVGCLCWGDRGGPALVLGLVIGVLAVALTVGTGIEGGIALVLPVISLLGLSGAALLERRWQPTTGLVISLTAQVIVAAGAFSVWAVLTGSMQARVTPAFVGAIVWLVLLSGIGGYATFIACLRRIGAIGTSALLYLTPAVTALWTWAMFGEGLSGRQVAGLALGAAAVLLVVRVRPLDTDPLGGAVSSGGQVSRRTPRAAR